MRLDFHFFEEASSEMTYPLLSPEQLSKSFLLDHFRCRIDWICWVKREEHLRKSPAASILMDLGRPPGCISRKRTPVCRPRRYLCNGRLHCPSGLTSNRFSSAFSSLTVMLDWMSIINNRNCLLIGQDLDGENWYQMRFQLLINPWDEYVHIYISENLLYRCICSIRRQNISNNGSRAKTKKSILSLYLCTQ